MKRVGTWIAVAIIVVGLVAIGSLFVKGDTERTDDAQVDQYVSPVNVRVAGYVKEIRFTEHQWVRQGDTLLVIDDREYRIHLKQAEAALLEARGGKQVATIMRAEAAVDMARLNLSYTVVTAPCDGYTGRRNLEVGQLVSPGLAITTLIPSSSKWITANFKETQMSRIREGQRVAIKIDALSDKTFEGHVLAISSATGSKYSLMPTDNAAGNFVKIQQRVPVKISIETLQRTRTDTWRLG